MTASLFAGQAAGAVRAGRRVPWLRTVARRLGAVALLCGCGGCYSYLELPFGAVPPGADVRVEVTRETAGRLSDALAQDQRSVEGRVQANRDNALLLEVVTTTRQVGFRFEPLRQTIRLEPSDVTTVQQKSFDRGQTAILVAMVGTALGAIAWKALGGKSGGDTEVNDPNQPADGRVVRPILKIPLHLPWAR